ncbi:MAG: sialate O-acetylesterase [Bacteroidales bacterium]|nr:sialate O-acetylesterase [Bacteroidales bacterium]
MRLSRLFLITIMIVMPLRVSAQVAPAGELWLFSGQSNMELPINRCLDVVEDDVKGYTSDKIHYAKVPMAYNFSWPEQIKEFSSLQWENLSSDVTAQDWGALAYFTARYLSESTGKEIWALNSSVGGSPIEAWLPSEELPEKSKQRLLQVRDSKWMADTRYHNAHLYSDWQGKHNSIPSDPDAKWTKLDDMFSSWSLDKEGSPIYGSHLLRISFKLKKNQVGDALLRLGAMLDADSTFVNGHYVGNVTYRYPPRKYNVKGEYLKAGVNTIEIHLYATENAASFVPDKFYRLETRNGNVDLTSGWEYKPGKRMPKRDPEVFLQYEPTGLYNSMIRPYTELPVKGVVWYQGESNVENADEYAFLLERMILSWRKAFQNPELPFYIVELGNYEHSERMTPETSAWIRVQRAQKAVADKMDNVYFIPNADLGEWNDIHPQDKKTLGQRVVSEILKH